MSGHPKRWLGALLAIGMLAGGGGAVLGQATPGIEGALAHPAHIHSGPCDTLGDVVYPLAEVRMPGLGGTPTAELEPIASPAAPGLLPEMVGESITVVEAPLEDILAAEHAINVHESAENIGAYIACGNVTGEPTDGSLTIDLEELNGSGYTGQATLLDNGDGTTTVLMTMMRGDAGVTPALTGLGDTTVGIAEFDFTPQTVTIPAGGSVTWVNNDTVPHTATGQDPAVLQSGTIEPGSDFTQVFDTPGTYEYFCEFHPDMTGTVIVQ